MKIAITTVQIPFVSGGAELHAVNLKNALIANGHEAEIVTIPFQDSPVSLIEDHIIASRLFDLSYSWGGRVDLCIGLKFPAYFIPHDNKVCWILHQHRAAYDLFDTEYSNLKNIPEGRKIREIITRADNTYLPEAKRIYANSQNVADRLMKYNGLTANPLYHPCPDMDKFYAGDYGDYVLMPSRINITKRQMLAVEAMSLTKTPVRLCIMGKAENDYEKERLLSEIKKYGLEERISYLDYVSQEEKFKLYANARAVLFIPVDEDYGYITLEAMSSSRPVITVADSGGPLEFIKNGENGLVVKPSAEDIAEALDEIYKSKTMAKEFGTRAKEDLDDMDISWDHVVKELTKNE